MKGEIVFELLLPIFFLVLMIPFTIWAAGVVACYEEKEDFDQKSKEKEEAYRELAEKPYSADRQERFLCMSDVFKRQRAVSCYRPWKKLFFVSKNTKVCYGDVAKWQTRQP